MTNEQKRIKIAEACGWYAIAFDRGWIRVGDGEMQAKVPDYLKDLNAMHEAEKVLTGWDQLVSYQSWLGYCGENNASEIHACIHATATQRAEAFGKTMKLW